jgi:NAD(P)-dependent dehydrogenase (short-subunit alcohol dehydrogenase family)
MGTMSETSEVDGRLRAERTVVLFGHTSELGQALCSRLLARGDTVVGVSRSPAPRDAARLTQIQADLARDDDVLRVVEHIERDYPAFGVLIYAAGILAAHDMAAIDYADLELVYRLNTLVPMYIESRLYKHIDANAADVVNITSSVIRGASPKFTAYSGSKMALQRFGEDLGHNLQASTARVIEICPSGFSSSIYQNMLGTKLTRDESIQIPASDLAELILGILDLPKVIELSYVFVNRKNGRPLSS